MMTPSTSAARTERQPIPLPDGPNSPSCPKCAGRMWDNRASKRNPRAPDFKCRNRGCDGVLWPGQHRSTIPATSAPRLAEVSDDAPTAENETEDNVERLLPLRRKYLDLTEFVIRFVRPKYEEAGFECRADTVAAIAATLYIAETRREGL
jgi:hypothetical protein